MLRLHPWLAAALLVGSAALAVSAEAAPKKSKKSETAAPKEEASADFDRQAAATAISEVSLQKCKATNAPKGDGHVMITFTPGGSATTAQVDKGPWVGTPVAKCMGKAFKKTKVPAFKGESVTVGKTFHFE
jgi:hypothetical protein